MQAVSVVVLSLMTLMLLSAEARKSDGMVHTEIIGTELVSRLHKGFHFNKDAPASLKTADGKILENPTQKEESEIIFEIGKINKHNFSVSFYVCDNANTVCEEHTKNFVNNLEVTEIEAPKPSNSQKLTSTLAVKSRTTGEINSNGFIEDNLLLAKKKALLRKALILIDFRAAWCPACIRLETEVFPQAIFKNATTKFVKLSINVDLDENKELAKRYAIKAIPTIIVVDNDGNEIFRSLDYKPTAELSSEFKKLTNSEYLTYGSLKLEAEAGNEEAMYALGLRGYRALDYSEAVKWLSSIKANRRLFANAEVSYWAEQVDTEAKTMRSYTGVLEKWIAMFPQTYEAVTWRNELADKLSKKDQPLNPEIQQVLETNAVIVKEALRSATSLQKFFAKNYIGDFSKFEKVELHRQLITTYKLLKQSTLKDKAQKLAGAELQKIKLSPVRPGEMLVAISYMRQLDRVTEAQVALEELVQTYPDGYVYYSKLARFYFAEKEFKKALPLAQKAVSLDTSVLLKNLQFLAEVQKALDQKQDAVVTINRALALPQAKLAHNKKIANSLSEFKKTLE